MLLIGLQEIQRGKIKGNINLTEVVNGNSRIFMKITNTKEISNNRVCAVICGISGVGKTSLAKTLNGKTLILSAEQGLLCLAGSDIDVIEIKSFNDLLDTAKFLRTPEAKVYQNIFLDSLTEVSEILIAELKLKYPSRAQSMNLWGEYADLMLNFVKYYRNLNQFNVFFTCLIDTQKDELGVRYHHFDLKGKIAEKIPALFDLVFFADILDIETEGKVVPTRVLYTQPTEKHRLAKDRSGLLKPIIKMDLQLVVDKLTKNSSAEAAK